MLIKGFFVPDRGHALFLGFIGMKYLTLQLTNIYKQG
jgi:hypothetical protein